MRREKQQFNWIGGHAPFDVTSWTTNLARQAFVFRHGRQVFVIVGVIRLLSRSIVVLLAKEGKECRCHKLTRDGIPC